MIEDYFDGCRCGKTGGQCRTVVDYILSRKGERKMVKDVKVVRIECIKQHRLLICVFDLKERVGLKCKVKPVKRCKVWKLKQAETKNHLQRKGSGCCFEEERTWGC